MTWWAASALALASAALGFALGYGKAEYDAAVREEDAGKGALERPRPSDTHRRVVFLVGFICAAYVTAAWLAFGR